MSNFQASTFKRRNFTALYGVAFVQYLSRTGPTSP
jgi:hypothetical protein